VPDQGELRRYYAARALDGKPFRSACYAPTVSLYFYPTGRVQACCKNDRFPLGDVRRDSLSAIWRGARIGRLRDALRRDQFGAGCEQCAWQIEASNLRDVYTRIFDDLPVESSVPQWPAMMEFAVSNACNFACVMCYGELSSSLRAKEGLPPLENPYGERFFAELREFLPHLKRAKFFGGEPFLAGETFRIVDAMTADGLRIDCHATTNGSIWNSRVERALAAQPFSITVSVDGATKETFESIRRQSDFEQVHANLRRFHAHARAEGNWFNLAFCLMRQNWRELVDVFRLAEELGCECYINTVTDPPGCSIYSLTEEEQQRIADALEQAAADAGASIARNREHLLHEVASLRRHATLGLRQRIAEVRRLPVVSVAPAREPVAAALVDRAWQLLAERRYKEAFDAVAAAGAAHDSATIDPARTIHLAAQLALETGDALRAAERFDRLLLMRSGHPDFRVGRAWAALLLGERQRARDEAEAVLRERPDHAGARHLAAMSGAAVSGEAPSGETPS
jgi:MoaA/NifB/PqqE/SkfB family radical SAM enzyme